jgi:hypothetical protein
LELRSTREEAPLNSGSAGHQLDRKLLVKRLGTVAVL